MNAADAEEYTQALGQVAAGAWRQIALGERLGVPSTLGLSTREWVEQRLGGYVRLSIPDRREAVAELAEEGHSQREIAEVLGVSKTTVDRDLEPSGPNGPAEPEAEASSQVEPEPASPPGPSGPTAEEAPREAVTEFLESDEDLQRARYLHEFLKVLVRADEVMKFDPEKLGGAADNDLVESIESHTDRLNRFTERFRKARRGLRVISGGTQ